MSRAQFQYLVPSKRCTLHTRVHGRFLECFLYNLALLEDLYMSYLAWTCRDKFQSSTLKLLEKAGSMHSIFFALNMTKTGQSLFYQGGDRLHHHQSSTHHHHSSTHQFEACKGFAFLNTWSSSLVKPTHPQCPCHISCAKHYHITAIMCNIGHYSSIFKLQPCNSHILPPTHAAARIVWQWQWFLTRLG